MPLNHAFFNTPSIRRGCILYCMKEKGCGIDMGTISEPDSEAYCCNGQIKYIVVGVYSHTINDQVRLAPMKEDVGW